MHPYSEGRHEHGQNFLHDTRIIAQVIDLVARTEGPILEIGSGEGALTLPMERLGRPITAVEIHPGTAERLRARTRRSTEVITADFLRQPLPPAPHVVVGNLPFHLTTAVLRHLLHGHGWSEAVLITQWEVARRRAGVGGSSMMTAQWSPFFDFRLAGRVAARCYTPAPSVDGGLLTISRRASPLLQWNQQRAYAGFVHRVFTGQGRGITQILRNICGMQKAEVGRRLGELSIRSTALPKELTAEQWAGLYRRLGKTERAGPHDGSRARKQRRPQGRR